MYLIASTNTSPHFLVPCVALENVLEIHRQRISVFNRVFGKALFSGALAKFFIQDWVMFCFAEQSFIILIFKVPLWNNIILSQ